MPGGPCNSPIVVLDGLPVPYPELLFETIPLETIETVEVLSPAQAGVRYGTLGSANGVVLIETRPPMRQRRVTAGGDPISLRAYDWRLEHRIADWQCCRCCAGHRHCWAVHILRLRSGHGSRLWCSRHHRFGCGCPGGPHDQWEPGRSVGGWHGPIIRSVAALSAGSGGRRYRGIRLLLTGNFRWARSPEIRWRSGHLLGATHCPHPGRSPAPQEPLKGPQPAIRTGFWKTELPSHPSVSR